ncbi:MAG: hypothetical protein OXC07_07645 [Kistimonas sp.]|nr:hypothetical protein [Kistimonas sp.]
MSLSMPEHRFGAGRRNVAINGREGQPIRSEPAIQTSLARQAVRQSQQHGRLMLTAKTPAAARHAAELTGSFMAQTEKEPGLSICDEHKIQCHCTASSREEPDK